MANFVDGFLPVGPGNFLWHKEQVKAEELESSYLQTAGPEVPNPQPRGGADTQV